MRQQVDLLDARLEQRPDEVDEVGDDLVALVALKESLRLEVGQLARGGPAEDERFQVA